MNTDRMCNICNKKKPLSEFFRDRSASDGYQYRCKDCDKEKSVRWQQASGYNSAKKRLNKDNPKRQAKSAILNAVRQGDLPKVKTLRCGDCGERAKEYHHGSYEREHWLDVVPLCVQCHRKRHGRPTYPEHLTADQLTR